MSAQARIEPYLTVAEYLGMERLSPFKHEFADGVMYAMHCESSSDYLEMETASPFRHEYVDGVMYAMAGGKKAHHLIERNLTSLLHTGLRGTSCSSTTSQMKLRLAAAGDEAFYFYPDGMITCDRTDGGETDGHAWIERPTVIFEITSASTRHLDEGRKRDAYLGLTSLEAYVRMEQDRASVVVERRAGSLWVIEHFAGLEGVLQLPAVALLLPMAALYEDVELLT